MFAADQPQDLLHRYLNLCAGVDNIIAAFRRLGRLHSIHDSIFMRRSQSLSEFNPDWESFPFTKTPFY